MFCLSKRSNGYYYIFYTGTSGKTTCKSTRTKNKSDALMYLLNFREEIRKAEQQKIIPKLLSQFISEFLDYSKMVHTPKTVFAYRNSLKYLQKYFGERLISQISKNEMITYLDIRLRESSIYQARKDLICFSSCFNYALTRNLIVENPCKGIKRIKLPQKQPLFFTEEEFSSLVNIIDKPVIRDIAIFAVNTGLRQMEILTLLWTQVDFKARMLILDNRNHLTKSKKIRSIPLNDKTFSVLQERNKRRSSEFVFTRKGRKINQDYIVKQFKKYVIEAKLNPSLSFHSLRHTFASWLIQRGVSIYNVSKLLGHSDIKVTEIYTHLRTEDLQNSVNMLNE